MRFMHNKIIYLSPVFLIGIIFAILNKPLLLKEPPVWPDDSLFASPAYILATHGYLGSELYYGIVPGLERYTYSNPPLYFLFLAGIIKLFGMNILVLRWTSVALGMSLFVLLFFLAKAVARTGWVGILACTLLAIDPEFLRGCRIARPDILCVVLITAASYFYARCINCPAHKVNLTMTGLCMGLAVLTHPLGLIAVISICIHYFINVARGKARLSGTVYLLIPFLLLIALWGIYIAQHYTYFEKQMLGQFGRKMGVRYWLWSLWGQSGRRVSLLIYIAATLGIFTISLRGKDNSLFFLSLLCSTALIMALSGREMWYSIYYAPFCAFAVALCAGRLWRIRAPVPCIALFFIGFLIYNNAADYRWTYIATMRYDYSGICEDIEKELRPHSTIFLHCVPDPYFCLINSPKSLTIREFHPTAPLADLKAAIARSDYLIISPGDTYLVKDMPPWRIKRIVRIGAHQPGQYQLLLVEFRNIRREEE